MIGSYELGKTADKYISGDASFTWEEIKGDLFKVAMTGTSMWGSAKDFGTSYCFVAGTLVTTEDGQEPIEEIEVGDKVLSEDETTGEVAVKTVTETYVNETDELIHIGVNGETISATPTHPFYVDKLGWTLARSLRAGDVLVLSNGELVTVEWVQHEILESPIKVYNFEVQDFHTYFVGENGIFVHNGCGVGDNNQTTVYRTLRDDESIVDGLVAKNPDRGMTMSGHISSGSRNNGSQFISTTTEINVAKKWASKDGKRVVSINLEMLPSNTKVYDVSTDIGRAKYLSGATANRLAKSSSEVLIEGYIPAEALELLFDFGG